MRRIGFTLQSKEGNGSTAMKVTQGPTSQVLKFLNCAIYTRKSSDENLHTGFTSLDAQREYCESFIKARGGEGWQTYPEQYNDPGFSGGNMKRPALQKLLADAARKKFDVVVAYKFDRLSRNTKDFLDILNIFDAHGIAFVSVTQPIDTTSSVGRLMRSILMDFSQFEREMVGERTRDKLDAMARRGQRTGGTPVLGYDVDPSTKQFKVNPEESEQVRQVFTTYLKTKSLSVAAKTLNAKGYRMKSWITKPPESKVKGGQKFTRSNLWNLLRNPGYLGKITHRRKVLPGKHEPIMSEEIFSKVQEMLAANGHARVYRSRSPESYPYLLRGLVRCASCQMAMTPHTVMPKNKPRFFYYRCVSTLKMDKTACKVRSVPAKALEDYVLQRLEIISQNVTTVERIVQKARVALGGDLPEKRKEMLRMKNELGKTDLQAKNLVAVLAEEGAQSTMRSFVTQQFGELEENKKNIECEILSLEREIEDLETKQIDADVVRHTLGNFMAVIKEIPLNQKQDLMKLLIEEILYDHENRNIKIGFRPLPEAWGDLNLLQSHFNCLGTGQEVDTSSERDPDKSVFVECRGKLRIVDTKQIECNEIPQNKRPFDPFFRPNSRFRLWDDSNFGTCKIAKGRIVTTATNYAEAVTNSQRRYFPPPESRPPTIQRLLKLAFQLKERLDKSPGLTRFALAKEQGINHSFLSRILNLLNLAPEIQKYILLMPSSNRQTPISEKRLKHLARMSDHQKQISEFNRLKEIPSKALLPSPRVTNLFLNINPTRFPTDIDYNGPPTVGELN